MQAIGSPAEVCRTGHTHACLVLAIVLILQLPAPSRSLKHGVLNVQMCYTASVKCRACDRSTKFNANEYRYCRAGKLLQPTQSNIECTNGCIGASAAPVQAQLSATWAGARPGAYSTVITGVVKIGILSSVVYLQAVSQSANISCLTILSVYATHCWNPACMQSTLGRQAHSTR